MAVLAAEIAIIFLFKVHMLTCLGACVDHCSLLTEQAHQSMYKHEPSRLHVACPCLVIGSCWDML